MFRFLAIKGLYRPKPGQKRTHRLESTRLKKDSLGRLREKEREILKLRFSFRGEKMVAMMEEYAEIDLIKTRRLQIEVTGFEYKWSKIVESMEKSHF